MSEQMLRMRRNLDGMQGVLRQIRHLANEIEVLNPTVRRDGHRPDNREYPWEAGDNVMSPLDWTFTPLRLLYCPLRTDLSQTPPWGDRYDPQ